VGIDDGSENRCRVYWPTRNMVTIERNVYWDPSNNELLSHKGEENDDIPNTMIMSPSQIPTATLSMSITAPPTPKAPPFLQTPAVPTSPILETVAKHVRKPSQCVLDIIRQTVTVPRGIQLPTAQPQVIKEMTIEGESTAEQLMAILEDPDDKLCLLNSAMAIGERITEAEALEPSTLAEVKCHPDWAQWEEGIREELATLKVAGTWELTDLPTGANLIGSKWGFHAKKTLLEMWYVTKLTWLLKDFPKYLVSISLTYTPQLPTSHQLELS
jgi:hypothetical protein